MLRFSWNSSSPQLTSQSHWNSDCSPSITSVQHLSQAKTRPPMAGSFQMLCWSGKDRCFSSAFVCALSCLLGYWEHTVSQSGMETGAPLQRIEGLDVRVARRARVNVAYTRVTGRLRYFRLQCWGFTEATYHFIMGPAGCCFFFFPLANNQSY